MKDNVQKFETANGSFLENATSFNVSRLEGSPEFVREIMNSVQKGNILQFRKIPLIEHYLRIMYNPTALSLIEHAFGSIEITESTCRSLSPTNDLFLLSGNINSIGDGPFQLSKPELIIASNINYYNNDSRFRLEAVFRIQSEITLLGRKINIFIDFVKESDWDISFEAPSGLTISDIFDLFSTESNSASLKAFIRETSLDCFSLRMVQIGVSLKDNFSTVNKLVVQSKVLLFQKLQLELTITDKQHTIYIEGNSALSSYKLRDLLAVGGIKQEHLSTIPNFDTSLQFYSEINSESNNIAFTILTYLSYELENYRFSISEGFEILLQNIGFEIAYSQGFQVKCDIIGKISDVEVEFEGKYDNENGFVFK